MATKEEILDAIASMTVLELKRAARRTSRSASASPPRRPSPWPPPPRPVAAAAAGRRGAGRVRRRPHRRRRQEDPGHQGGPRPHEPRPQGGQGPRRRRPQAGAREGVEGRRREGQGASSRRPAPPSSSSSRPRLTPHRIAPEATTTGRGLRSFPDRVRRRSTRRSHRAGRCAGDHDLLVEWVGRSCGRPGRGGDDPHGVRQRGPDDAGTVIVPVTSPGRPGARAARGLPCLRPRARPGRRVVGRRRAPGPRRRAGNAVDLGGRPRRRPVTGWGRSPPATRSTTRPRPGRGLAASVIARCATCAAGRVARADRAGSTPTCGGSSAGLGEDEAGSWPRSARSSPTGRTTRCCSTPASARTGRSWWPLLLLSAVGVADADLALLPDPGRGAGRPARSARVDRGAPRRRRLDAGRPAVLEAASRLAVRIAAGVRHAGADGGRVSVAQRTGRTTSVHVDSRPGERRARERKEARWPRRRARRRTRQEGRRRSRAREPIGCTPGRRVHPPRVARRPDAGVTGRSGAATDRPRFVISSKCAEALTCPADRLTLPATCTGK